MWVRGLKLVAVCSAIVAFFVAPYVGAWIETLSATIQVEVLQRRTLCGCVD